jgi:hypothetical protein
VGSLNAASSGLQAGIAVLRGSTDAAGLGDRGRLPCTSGLTTTFRTGTATANTPGSVVTADAALVPGSYRFEAHLAYYLLDPTDRPPSWLQANVLSCPLTVTPRFAYLQSYGTGANVAGSGGSTGTRGNRAQTAVYRFSGQMTNIPGGRLRQFAKDICIDAGSNPRIGTPLTYEACAVRGTKPSQLWEYREDLTLLYAGNTAINLCIQGTSSVAPTLRRCTGVGTGTTFPYASTQQLSQMWAFNDQGHFAVPYADGSVPTSVGEGHCLQPKNPSVGADVQVTPCQGDSTSFYSFDPDPETGAGKAGGNTTGLPGAPTNQYVNFGEFGRCLDITAQDVTIPYLIAYPCKQAPSSSTLTWNQVWRWTVVSGNRGRMHVNVGSAGTAYCLTAPATGSLVITTPCSTSRPDQEWTATGGATGGVGGPYTLLSATRAQCLSVTRTLGLAYGSGKIVVEPCDGRPVQRWNAPPSGTPAGLSDVAEGSIRP